MNTNDPIIAAIEAHRRACAETRAGYERLSAVADELGAGVRVPAGEAEQDPRWFAANDAVEKALSVQDDLAVKLLETRPTTIAGAAALLTYYVDVTATPQAEVIFPDLDVIGRLLESKSTDEPWRDFGYLIVRNVATALSNMAANVAAPSVASYDDLVPASVLRSGVVDGLTYTLYSDGSIEAQLPEGIQRFGSIAELRNYLEQSALNVDFHPEPGTQAIESRGQGPTGPLHRDKWRDAAYDDSVPVSVLRSGIVDGMTYTLYSDGSVEAHLPEGILRFGSITELRHYLEQSA